jgi:ABC-type Mn2+/Zn2+ transport system permease subunit
LHYWLREEFFLISFDIDEAERRGRSVRLWDFYATFGLGTNVRSGTLASRRLARWRLAAAACR